MGDKNKTLLKELAALSDPTPSVLVVEDHEEDYAQLDAFQPPDEDEEGWQTVGADGEVVPKNLRRLTAPALEETDARYRGRKVQRKDLESSDNEDIEEDEELEEEDEAESDGEESPDVMELDDDDVEEDQSVDDEQDEEEGAEYVIGGHETEMDTQAAKGKAVQQQFKLWDQLMGTRIRMQKLLQAANQMPQNELEVHLKTKESREKQKSAVKSMEGILCKLVDFQTELYSKSSPLASVVKGGTGKKAEDDEIPSSSENEEEEEMEVESRRKKLSVPEALKLADQRHEDYKPYRDETLRKWFERTKVASGKFSSKFSNFDTDVIKQINQIMTNKQRLIARTQTKRSEFVVFGKEVKENEEEDSKDVEIMDDQDFYQNLLRELIQRKSGSGTKDPVSMTRQWIEMERMRQKKKKKAVDTKASKGRKVRYEVKQKLVNLMAPVEQRGVWRGEEAKNELFASLFGNRPQEP